MSLRIVYLHGFASSPQSEKAQYFKEKFSAYGIPVEIPQLDEGNFEALTITGQLGVVDRTVGGRPAVLMGSSLGGYLAALYAARHPQNVERVILMAPAFRFPSLWRRRYTAQELDEWRHTGVTPVFHYAYDAEKMLGYQFLEDSQLYEQEPEFQQPALIFHGTEDDVVPAEFSRHFAAAHDHAELHLMQSGHELKDVLEPMWTITRRFLALRLSGD